LHICTRVARRWNTRNREKERKKERKKAGEVKKIVEDGACAMTWKSIQIMICWSGEYISNRAKR
jgi:hypothetical protein